MKKVMMGIGVITSIAVIAGIRIYLMPSEVATQDLSHTVKALEHHKRQPQIVTDKNSVNIETRQSQPHQIHSDANNEVNKDELAELKNGEIQQTLRLSINKLMKAINNNASSLTLDTLFDQLITQGIESQGAANLLSVALANEYREVDSDEKRLFLAELMLTVPGEASQKLGAELINSASEEERFLGLELMRTSDLVEPSTTQNLMSDTIWSETNEDISVAAIDILDSRMDNSPDRENTLFELSHIASAHSSDTVRASALIKMADIDQGEQTRLNLAEALNSENYTLQFASIIAVKRNSIVSPEINDQLLALANNQQTPSRLKLLAKEVLDFQ